jgi:hypothetical protein
MAAFVLNSTAMERALLLSAVLVLAAGRLVAHRSLIFQQARAERVVTAALAGRSIAH